MLKDLKPNFPILSRKINGNPLVFLDSASTTQKPKCVIDAISKFYETSNANIHRGIYTISEEATEQYEATREAIANFINAKTPNEIVFTKNTTEAINLVAQNFPLEEGDKIIVSALEHHSNLVPWQELCKRKGGKLKTIPLKDDLTLDMEAYENLLNPHEEATGEAGKVKLVAITGMSNVTGYAPDTKKIIQMAHRAGAQVLIDGAQSVAHSPTDVQDSDADFLTFSAHKMLGPTGVGILYGKEEALKNLAPYQFGGSMIKSVSQTDAEYAQAPDKFEAGTPNIADVIAFKAALDFLTKIGMENIQKHEQELTTYAISKLSKIPKAKIYSPGGGIISFTIKGIHPHDIAQILSDEGICIRAGHHCAEPLIKILKTPATARMSFYLYNTKEDVDTTIKALEKTINIFGV